MNSDEESSFNLVWITEFLVQLHKSHSLLWGGNDGLGSSLQVREIKLLQVHEEIFMVARFFAFATSKTAN